MYKLDKTDLAILELLQKDGKINVKVISEKLNISKTPIYERIRKMEKQGIISKYVALVDRHKLPSTIMVFCSVSIEDQGLQAIRDFNQAVSEIPEVVECYVMGGNVDFLLKLIVKDLDSYYHLVTSRLFALSNIKAVKSSFVLEQAKYSTAVPV